MLGDEVEWKSLADFPGVGEVVEDGATFAENARKKALGYAQATGLWTLADDSGLVVDALGGAPGVNSARFSGDKPKGVDRKVIDRRNWEKLLSLLQGVPNEKRTARFVCCLCLAGPGGGPHRNSGQRRRAHHRRSPPARAGSGTTRSFFVPQLGRTVAQLGDEEKNAVSHRGNAMKKLKPLLERASESRSRTARLNSKHEIRISCFRRAFFPVMSYPSQNTEQNPQRPVLTVWRMDVVCDGRLPQGRVSGSEAYLPPLGQSAVDLGSSGRYTIGSMRGFGAS